MCLILLVLAIGGLIADRLIPEASVDAIDAGLGTSTADVADELVVGDDIDHNPRAKEAAVAFIQGLRRNAE